MSGPQRFMILLVWFLICGIAVWQLVFRATVSSDMSVFLQSAGHSNYALLLEELNQGPGSRLIMAAIEGGTTEQLVVASRNLGEGLRRTELFAEVFNGVSPLTQSARDLIFRYRYLLDPQTERSPFSVPSLTQALKQRLSEMASSLSVLDRATLTADPTGAFASALESWRPQGVNMAFHEGSWVSEQRDAAYLLLRTHARGTDLDAQEQALTVIRSVFDQSLDRRSLRLELAGAPVIAVATRDQIRLEAFRLSSAATVILVILLLVVYRELRILLLTLLPLLSAILVAAAAVSASYELLHGITVVFGVTLLGVAVDYPVHLFSHCGSGESPESCIGRIWSTVRLGALTTVLGYAAMLLNPISGLSQMGAFTCVGLVTAAAATRYVLPAVMSPREKPVQSLAWVPHLLTQSPLPAVRWIALGIGLIAVAVVANVHQPWSTELTDLSPAPSAEVEQDRSLRSQMGAPDSRYVIAVIGDSADEVLNHQEMLTPILQESRHSQEMDTYRMASQYLPSISNQRRRQDALPQEELLRVNLSAATAGLPFRPDVFKPFVNDVVTSKTLKPLSWSMLRDVGLQLPLDPLLHPSQQGWLGVVQLAGVTRPVELSRRLEQWSRQEIAFVDIKRQTGALLDQFRNEALNRAAWAVLAVVVVLTLSLQDSKRLLRVLAPVLFAVATSAAVPLMTGAKLNLFHLVSLFLVAGIGLDYSLFFSRPDMEGQEIRATTHSILVCAASTSALFAILMLSSIPVLDAIGMVVATGVLSALFFTWALSARSPPTNESSTQASADNFHTNDRASPRSSEKPQPKHQEFSIAHTIQAP